MVSEAVQVKLVARMGLPRFVQFVWVKSVMNCTWYIDAGVVLQVSVIELPE